MRFECSLCDATHTWRSDTRFIYELVARGFGAAAEDGTQNQPSVSAAGANYRVFQDSDEMSDENLIHSCKSSPTCAEPRMKMNDRILFSGFMD